MTRCTAKTLKGVQCKNAALEGATKCKTHSTTIKVVKSKKAAPKKAKVAKTKKAKVAKAKVVYTPLSPMTEMEFNVKIPKAAKKTLSTFKNRVLGLVKDLKNIDDAELSSKSNKITFVVYDDPFDADAKCVNLDNALAGIKRALKGINHKVKMSEFDEERRRYAGTITFTTK